MKKLIFLSVAFSAIALLAFATVVSAQPEAICVPWQPSNPSIAHYTYSGASITLKGIARNIAPGATYEWDFGDGSPPDSATITNPYNLGVTHTYSGLVGQLFIATLTVSDSLGTDQDQYLIRIYESSDLSDPNHLDVRINMAIDEGLWWLHTNMIRDTYSAGSPGYEQPYGYWPETRYGYPLAAVGAAVDAFQLHGSKANTDYNSDPYVETVQRALNYVLTHTYSHSIGVQLAGDPDTNDNDIGLVANHTSYLYDHRQTYIGGICMVALASSGAPNRISAVGGTNVIGRTYAEIVQDMVDFFAWGQMDSGWARGGWRYYANYNSTDMSTTQWPPLGMMAAEENMASVVPQFVRDELALYMNVAQNTVLNNDHGGFAYYYPEYYDLYNVTKAAAGIICHEFLGTPLTNSSVQSAIGFIYRHWNDMGSSWSYQKLHGNSYGMYGVMKAFRIPEPDFTMVTEYDYNAGGQTANSFDWYYTPTGQSQQGLASYLVSTQQANGSWDDTTPAPNPVYDAFATGWRVLILLKGVTIIPPEAVICDCDEQEYNFDQDIHLDASCSYHPDITRSIVSYEWDLDNDGQFNDAAGETATIAGGFSVTGYYPVAVRVTDDNPANLGSPQTSIYTCLVYVHPPPHCPHAFAGGPYDGWVNVPVEFDASASWDPDNEIVLYEWDINNDGTFDYSGAEPTITHTWNAPYTGVVRLRVTDAVGVFEACSDEDFTTVDIGNHTPVCDPNGPYQAGPGTTVSLDGSGSHDIDPGDEITCAWDLDNDGEFDDAFECEAEMAVPPDAEDGTVYDMCLKVTDSYGEYDIGCTTVTVVPNQPPVADPDGPYTGDEGSSIDFDGTGSSDPDNDVLTYAWTFGDGNTGSGPNPSHTYADNDSYPVCLTVTDTEGAQDSTCTTATIDNVPPTITDLTGPIDPIEICTSFSMSGSFTDPGTADTHTAAWDWGDSNTSEGTVTETDGSGTVDDEYAYCDEAGVYTITLTVTDDDGGAATEVFQYVVVYDPSAGFVTGGGWIDSPEGAYSADPMLTGKATFGFVSKYKKGASTPTGNTEFQFHAGDLNFHSDSYQWLVIAGAKAKYKGSGTINGAGNYGFMLSAVEEKLTPSTDVDLFRIKIWDIDDGDAVVYDNGLEAADDADPTTEIQGGNIVIHKK